MKLGVNDYVRTKDGTIDKVIIEYNGHCASPHCNCKHVSCERDYYDEDEIVKSSPNIIDLIEVGDYVNGYLVIERDINNELRYIDLKDRNMKYVKNLDIKSIITKEQFSQMEYKL